jgi:hypothetical protein
MGGRSVKKKIAILAAACIALIGVGLVSTPAEAHRSRVFFGVSTYMGPPAYYPPPYYYYPAPVYYAPPPPVYYAPPAPAPAQQPYCREYQGNATVDSSGQPFYGRACLQPDGQWHIIN